MIPYYLAKSLIGLIALIFSPITFLPDATLPAGISSAFASAGAMLGPIHSTIPYTMGAIFGVILSLLGVEAAIFSYNFISGIYNKVRGSG